MHQVILGVYVMIIFYPLFNDTGPSIRPNGQLSIVIEGLIMIYCIVVMERFGQYGVAIA